MAIAQFNIKQINMLKDILLRLHDGESSEEIKADFLEAFENSAVTDILLAVYELKNGDHGITVDNILKLFQVYKQLFGHAIDDLHFTKVEDNSHPLQIFLDED